MYTESYVSIPHPYSPSATTVDADDDGEAVALTASTYSRFVQRDQQGDTPHYLGFDHLRHVIELNDVAALGEFLSRRPDVPAWIFDNAVGAAEPPPMVQAAILGHNEVLGVLLKHLAEVATLSSLSVDEGVVSIAGEHLRVDALTAACNSARVSTVQLLLETQPPIDIRRKDWHGRTPLVAALDCRVAWAYCPEMMEWTQEREQIVRLLLNRGADAAATLHLERTDSPASQDMIDDTALTLAMMFSTSEKVIQWLLDAGADVTAKADHSGLRKEYEKSDMTPLHVGCDFVNAVTVRALLDATGCTDITAVDGAGRTLVHTVVTGRCPSMNGRASPQAYRDRATEILHLLLEDDQTRDAIVNASDAKGRTPLHLAAAFEISWPLIPVLIAYGAHTTIRDTNGQMPLHTWCASLEETDLEDRENEYRESALKALGALLAEDTVCAATINAKDAEGRTALHMACQVPRIEIIRKFLEKGADPTIRDASSRTPQDVLLSFPPFDGLEDDFREDVEEVLVVLKCDKASVHLD